jgi:NAD-dependent deacetylase
LSIRPIPSDRPHNPLHAASHAGRAIPPPCPRDYTLACARIRRGLDWFRPTLCMRTTRLTLESLSELPARLLDSLHAAERITALTGAGVSAESGIPTFRDAHTGIWARHDPMTLASPQGFDADPETVWQWYQWRRTLIAENKPNAGHYALARLQTLCRELALITQNVDGFHQLAGSDRVLELHGNIHRNICSITHRGIDAEWIDRHPDKHPPPSPHHPSGLARPDVVWFGEALDSNILDAAFQAATSCDLMLVVGTAGAVQPAASIPVMAKQAGAVLVEINPVSSELTRLADWHLAGPSAKWLPALVGATG